MIRNKAESILKSTQRLYFQNKISVEKSVWLSKKLSYFAALKQFWNKTSGLAT